jgi:hypothetical protein
MDYERGLAQLRSRAAGTDWENDFLVLEQRLLDNLGRERRFGTQEALRNERAQIGDELNTLALRQIGLDFNSLCRAAPQAPGSGGHPAAEAAPHPPVLVSTTAGALRLTFSHDGGGLSLSAENIGEYELTDIHIALRPPPHVFLSTQLVRIPRLLAHASMNQYALTLFAVPNFDLPFSVSYRNRQAAIERFDVNLHIPEW